MEYDTDWDVDFRSQLENFAFGSQLLAITPRRHYGNQPVAGDERRALVENDPAVTPLIHRTNFIVVPDMTHYEHSQDSLRKSRGNMYIRLCSFVSRCPESPVLPVNEAIRKAYRLRPPRNVRPRRPRLQVHERLRPHSGYI